MANVESSKNVIVIGAGVVGLSTALKIQEKGHNVTILAEHFPSDPKSIKYTSLWAGAHHVSLAGDDLRQSRMDRETFDIMWAMSAPGTPTEGCFLRIPQTENYSEARGGYNVLRVMPEFRNLEKEEVAPNCASGVAFKTITIDSPVYLNYLMSRFLSGGGIVVRASIQHINEVIEGGATAFAKRRTPGPSVDAVIVCAGLGARALGGVEDKEMYPIRGQTVVLRAPWIRFGRTISSTDGLWTYIIPRRSGDVIVGGTKASNDWHSSPRLETTLDILKRGLALAPELAGPTVTAERTPTVEDLLPLIVEEGCGLRPARHGGIRLEVEWFDVPGKLENGMKIPVVYNYGHGGYGFQSSWGSASIAVKLLEGALLEGRK